MGNLLSSGNSSYEAPCQHDAAFQWGVCQRLGEVASNTMWDSETRRGAIGFLGEMYQNDGVWGDQANVKQWIVNILMQLSSLSGSEIQCMWTTHCDTQLILNMFVQISVLD
jgi:hypothetical protein